MSGARKTTESIEDEIERAASSRDIDLDRVQFLEEVDEGRRFRVIETDAESETDQVGFEILYPDAPHASSMFSRRLGQYMDELRSYLEDDPGDDQETGVAETPDEDPRETEQDDHADASRDTARSAEQNPSQESGGTAHKLEATISLDDESLEEFERLLDEELSERVELERRVDELEQRVDRLETALSGLAEVTMGDD